MNYVSLFLNLYNIYFFKSNMLKGLFFIFLLFRFLSAISQENIHVNIAWEKPKEIVFGEKKMIIPFITDQDFDLKKPNYYWLKKIEGSITSTISILSYQTGDALKEEITYLRTLITKKGTGWKGKIEMPKSLLTKKK